MSSLLKEHELFSFLHEHRATGKKDVTHTGMGDASSFKGRLAIPDEEYLKFLDLLNDYLFIKDGVPLNLIERPRKNESKPLMIDIDFHYSNETNKIRRFKKEQVSKFTTHIGETIKKFIQTEDYEMLRFFVTMRPAPGQGSNYVKDGIHILCPDIGLQNNKQKVIRNYILEEGLLNASFDGSGYINSEKDVYDESMTRDQGWFPYGESKPSIPPYLLSYVFVYDPNNNTWTEEDITTYTSRQLLELLSVRYKIVEDDNVVRPEVLEAYQQLLADKPRETIQEESNTITVNRQDYTMPPPSEQEVSLLQRLVLECLSVERSDNRDTWKRVGWCLNNIDKSEDMFNLWIDFSRKSSKFRENEVSQHRADFFYKMNTDPNGPKLTERSLYSWARKDNLEAYKKIIDEDIFAYIRQGVDGTHYHMAKLMKKMYKNNYVASINNRDVDWYYYDDTQNMWKHLNQGIQLKTKISTEVAGYIAQVGNKFSLRASDERVSESERKVAIEEMKRFQKMQYNLYTNGFVESTMSMAEAVFCDEDFTGKLNTNTNLFACKNGVLQLRTVTADKPEEHVIFRTGIPEDYLSFLAGYNFQETDAINYIPYNASNPIYAEIYDFFDKIFPNIDLRDYFLRLLASCLEGANREQCYYTWEGVGGNGKSKITELMRITFGDYQTSLQATTLTRKRPESGAANPDIIAIKNKRFIYLSEPDDKEPLNTSRMKQFSGEDMIEARGLFKDQEKFKVTGKLNMMCNSKPIIRSMDRGTWRRIRVIPFESKFVEADDPEYISKRKNVFLRDNDLDKKLKVWREPFLSLLVHVYETQYLVAGLEPTPAIVKKASEEYKESSDSFAKFQNERIREELGAETNFKVIDRSYRKWSKLLGGAAQTLNTSDLLKRINNEYGEPVDGKYFNRRVFMDEEDIDAFDNVNQSG